MYPSVTTISICSCNSYAVTAASTDPPVFDTTRASVSPSDVWPLGSMDEPISCTQHCLSLSCASSPNKTTNLENLSVEDKIQM